MATAERLDVRGLLCPLPVLRTARRVESLRPGDRLEIVADDPLFRLDVQAWCATQGHEIVTLEESAGELRCLMRVGARPPGSVR